MENNFTVENLETYCFQLLKLMKFISSFNPCMLILVNDVTTNLSDRFRSEGSISVSEPKALCNRAI